MSKKLVYSEICDVEFYIPSEEEIIKTSAVEVKTSNIFKEGLADPDGIYDAHMGTTDLEWNCETCKNQKSNCPGHAGHYVLKYPILSPLFIKETMLWLNVVCHKCGALILGNVQIKAAKSRLLMEYSKKSKDKKCPNCDVANPKVLQNKNEKTTIYIDQDPVPRQLYPHEIRHIFNRISDDTIYKVGKTPLSHPKNLVLYVIRVPPNSIRPDKKGVTDGKSSSTDDITILLQEIIKYNNSLPNEIPRIDQMSFEYIKSINMVNNFYYALVKGLSNNAKSKRGMITATKKSLKSLADRMPRKYGRLRQNLLGARVCRIARSVINSDIFLKVDEVGIPLYQAREIQVRETVTEYNYARLNKYYLNGTNRYPGCTDVVKAGSKQAGSGYNVSKLHLIGYKLKVGDILYRDVVDGDICIINREPSLSNTSSLAHRVVILPYSDTIKINILACPFFNADFDGDQMSAIFTASPIVMNEIKLLSSPSRFFLSYQTSAPIVGQAQDSMIGSAVMTLSRTKLDKFHMMNILGSIDIAPKFHDLDKIYSGRDLYSILFMNRGYYINLRANAKLYDPIYAPYVNYVDTDIHVNITRGEFLSGIIDKSTIGSGTHGSIFHLLYHKYGAHAALQTAHDMQHIVINYLKYHGFTFSLADAIVNERSKEEIRRIESGIIDGAKVITEELNNAKIFPPIGKTIREYYEEKTIAQMDSGDLLIKPIFDSIDFFENSFSMLVFSGSRGGPNNLRSCVSNIGQVLLGGKRAKKKLTGRNVAYYQRFDDNPIAHGYVANSYISGVSPVEFIFNAMDSRISLIQIALGTAVSGEQNRNYIKNLESQIINNLRQVMDGNKILTPIYGGDGSDSRFLEYVVFLTMSANMSDAEFKEKYHAQSSQFKKFDNANVQSLFDKEFAQLSEDRDYYRNLFVERERMTNIMYTDKRLSPVNVLRIIDDIQYQFKDVKKDEFNPVRMLERINQLCDEISYVLLNEYQRQERKPIPEYMYACTKMLRILIRSHLNTMNLHRKNISYKELQLICTEIYETYLRSLMIYGTTVGTIAAQALSEPMTQMTLDSKHAAGLGAVGKVKGMGPIKEIIGVKKTALLKSPMTVLPVKAEYAKDKSKVREIANNIEMLKFRDFIVYCQIMFEENRIPVHPAVLEDIEMIENFKKYNIVAKEPTDLSSWSLRFELDKPKMILKQIDIELIYMKLREMFDYIYIIFSPENANKVIMRIYLRNNIPKKAQIDVQFMKNVRDVIIDTIIRGVSGIIAANVVEISKNRIITEGDNKGKIELEKFYTIVTNGTNMNKLVENPYLDHEHMQSDGIREMFDFAGITATEKKIANELYEQVPISWQQYFPFVNAMCYLGYPTPVKRHGLKKREGRHFMLPMAESSPVSNMIDAAINNYKDDISTSISGKLLVANPPHVGSLYNEYVVDEEFIKANLKSVDNVLDNL